ncbi:MAG: TerC/Alx family metal homeostasis membrane protein [Planctomycetaceae bacterium]
MITGWAWFFFAAFLLIMLSADLGIWHRKPRTPGFREAVLWSLVWAALALVFSGGLLVWAGGRTATEFMAAWLIEKSLSIDNVFVFTLIFQSLQVPRELQHRVLFWGVFGALLMRFVMILAGLELLEKVHWLVYVFGIQLIIAAVGMMRSGGSVQVLRVPWLIRRLQGWVPSSCELSGDSFFVRSSGRLLATPLLWALLMAEWSDLVFAIDSIPVVLSVSRDPFVVFTSNAFAILGLRSLYFAIAGLLDHCRNLHYGLAALLGFAGVKMLLSGFMPVPPSVSLVVILMIVLCIGLTFRRGAVQIHRAAG